MTTTIEPRDDAAAPSSTPDAGGGGGGGGGLLDFIERVGNRLPDPTTLFLLGLGLVMVLSAVAVNGDWSVRKALPRPVMVEEVDPETGETVMVEARDEAGEALVEWVATDEVLRAENLLDRDGIYWLLSSLVDNFTVVPPLGVVLVGMLGIGLAERVGLIGALLKVLTVAVPNHLLTPTMVFMGIMSSMTIDAGYVVLPPIAAALYKAAGRSPLAGLAAVFAGVSAGFNANLLPTGLDPMLAGFANTGTRVVDPDYLVNPLCNWWFMAVSTVVITLTGWGVTAFFVERRLSRKPADEGGPAPVDPSDLAEQELTSTERKGLVAAGGTFAAIGAILLACALVPGGPLYTYHMPDPANPKADVVAEVWQAPPVEEGEPAPEPPADAHTLDDGTVLVKSDQTFDRWVDAIVPMLFLLFVLPGLAYGIAAGEIENDKKVAKLLMESMAAMAPIIVLAFFAAQFIEAFAYSGLDQMLALWGGQTLGRAGLDPGVLVVAFILVTLLFNMFMGSMSAKYAMFAPIFIPMFMLVGISPELTQAAYRIGDSTSNIITPLNAYLIIILVFMRQYVPKGGMGTLISTMVPYTIAFTIVWVIMILVWMQTGFPLGIDGELWYDITAAAG